MKKDSRKYNIYHGVMAGGRWVLFAIVSFIILFPVYWIFISSITPSGELFKTPIDYLPDHPTLESYKFLIENVGRLSVLYSVQWLHTDSHVSLQKESILLLHLLLQLC